MCVVLSSSTGVTVLDNVVMFTLFAATRSIDTHRALIWTHIAHGQFVRKICECKYARCTWKMYQLNEALN